MFCGDIKLILPMFYGDLKLILTALPRFGRFALICLRESLWILVFFSGFESLSPVLINNVYCTSYQRWDTKNSTSLQIYIRYLYKTSYFNNCYNILMFKHCNMQALAYSLLEIINLNIESTICTKNWLRVLIKIKCEYEYYIYKMRVRVQFVLHVSMHIRVYSRSNYSYSHSQNVLLALAYSCSFTRDRL